MGAVRRPQFNQEEREEFDSSASIDELLGAPYPRWLVASGVFLYCTIFWAVIWIAGVNGAAWLRAAATSPGAQ